MVTTSPARGFEGVTVRVACGSSLVVGVVGVVGASTRVPGTIEKETPHHAVYEREVTPYCVVPM